MTKKEFYEKLTQLFIQHFGPNFRNNRLEIKRRLQAGEAPEINELYQHASYELRLFGGGYQYSYYAKGLGRRYNIWDFDRLYKLWKHL